MDNVKIPTSTLIPRSALRKLYPELQPGATGVNSAIPIQSTQSNPQLQVSLVSEFPLPPLEADWNHIGVHANTTPEASLRARFIAALEKDPLAREYHDNPSHSWS